MSNRILMIINSFPPSGESGVQRPVKFLKYFARDGWETYVVTPKKPVMQLNMDESLEQNIPANAKIFKTRTWGINEDKLLDFRFEYSESSKSSKQYLWKLLKLINDIVFPYDKQIGWLPFALYTSIRLIKKYKIRNVYITASPYSALIGGIILKKLFGDKIFWVADYRDAWQFMPLIDELVLPFRKRLICKMDELTLKSSDFVIFPTRPILDRYVEKYKWLSGKSDIITNGYDDDDFMGAVPHKFEKFTFLYMGKIHHTQRNPIPLLKAIKKYMTIDFQYVHVGLIGKQRLNQIQAEDIDFYQFVGYKPHTEALSYALGADVNIIINNNDVESENVYTGKLFELLRAGKQIMVVGPQKGIIKDLLLELDAGAYAYVEDENDILKALEQVVKAAHTHRLNPENIKQFSRAECTKKLEQIFLNQYNA